MRLLRYLLLVVSFSISYGWYPSEDEEEHPGHCFSPNPAIGAMEKFEVKPVKGCRQAVCTEDGYINYRRCLTVAFPPCIFIPGNKSEPYPACCPEVVC